MFELKPSTYQVTNTWGVTWVTGAVVVPWAGVLCTGPKRRARLACGNQRAEGDERKDGRGLWLGRMRWAFGCWASRPRGKEEEGLGTSGQKQVGESLPFSFVFFIFISKPFQNNLKTSLKIF